MNPDSFAKDDRTVEAARMIADGMKRDLAVKADLVDALQTLLEVHEAMGFGQSHAARKARAALIATGAAS